MFLYILRRLGQAILTIFGVMIVTFLLFRVVAGDIASSNLGQRAPAQAKADWRHRYGYDMPKLINVHRQLQLLDQTRGINPLSIRSVPKTGSVAANALAFVLSNQQDQPKGNLSDTAALEVRQQLDSRYVWRMSASTPLADITEGRALTADPTAEMPKPQPMVEFSLANGQKFQVNLSGLSTVGEMIDRINSDPKNSGLLLARISDYRPIYFFNSQFFNHLENSITLRSRSFKDNRPLLDIVRERGPYSLSIMVPATAFEFMIGLAIAAVVAYYRGRAVDKIGVFISVLGMCIPFLAFMIYGQWLMFQIAPDRAYGILNRTNIYLPISIMVVAGLGPMVRFYRTIILDETNRDYVRTARAKGLPLSAVLFKHVLKNCMLPILTNLVLTIPFLVMGSLLVESYFCIPGLGDLMITSIFDGNEPIMSGLVFLTAVVYTLGVLVTDLCYALFDPRVRLS